jgi:hypothetical protein
MAKLHSEARDDAQLALANAIVKATRAIIMASRAKTSEQAVEAWKLWEDAANDFSLAGGIMKELKEKRG